MVEIRFLLIWRAVTAISEHEAGWNSGGLNYCLGETSRLAAGSKCRGKKNGQVVACVHEGCSGGRAGCHADPAIRYARRGKRYPMRQVGRLVKKRKQKCSENHRSEVAGGLSQERQ